jgi:hypothetical protein
LLPPAPDAELDAAAAWLHTRTKWDTWHSICATAETMLRLLSALCQVSREAVAGLHSASAHCSSER